MDQAYTRNSWCCVNYTDVKNTGSLNITNIYIYASTLTDETKDLMELIILAKHAAAGL